MALTDEGVGEELTEVTEADDGDLELLGVVELNSYFGFIVEGLSCVDGANCEGFSGSGDREISGAVNGECEGEGRKGV